MYHQKSKGQSAHATYKFEHECVLLAIQHSKLDATNIGRNFTIFEHVMNDLKRTACNGLLDTEVYTS